MNIERQVTRFIKVGSGATYTLVAYSFVGGKRDLSLGQVTHQSVSNAVGLSQGRRVRRLLPQHVQRSEHSSVEGKAATTTTAQKGMTSTRATTAKKAGDGGGGARWGSIFLS